MEQSKSDSSPLDVNDHPDCSPVGSPDLADSHLPLLPPPGDLPPPVLSGDLRDKIIKQVEYYFSDENLVSDKFLLKYVMKNKDGYVPIGVIASFRKLKSLTKETSLIVSALRESSTLIVSSNGKKVKRRHPFPVSVLLKDPSACTVLVENLPEDHSLDNLRKVFGEAGNVENVEVREANAVKDTKNVTTAEKLLVGKLHALVEYDSVEAAEKAVALLNNEHDWRYGLRVKLLKKLGKPEQRKIYKEVNGGEKSSVSNPGVDNENAVSREHHQDAHGEELKDGGEKLVGEDKGGEQTQKEKKMKKPKNGDHHHVQKEKNEHKNRYHQGQGQGHCQGQGHGHGQGQGQCQGQGHGHGQGQGHGHGQGRRQKHGSNPNAHGHGAPTAHNVEVSKPPPGPRMPDGTRGFAIGRGRALVPGTTTS